MTPQSLITVLAASVILAVALLMSLNLRAGRWPQDAVVFAMALASGQYVLLRQPSASLRRPPLASAPVAHFQASA